MKKIYVALVLMLCSSTLLVAQTPIDLTNIQAKMGNSYAYKRYKQDMGSLLCYKKLNAQGVPEEVCEAGSSYQSALVVSALLKQKGQNQVWNFDVAGARFNYQQTLDGTISYINTNLAALPASTTTVGAGANFATKVVGNGSYSGNTPFTLYEYFLTSNGLLANKGFHYTAGTFLRTNSYTPATTVHTLPLNTGSTWTTPVIIGLQQEPTRPDLNYESEVTAKEDGSGMCVLSSLGINHPCIRYERVEKAFIWVQNIGTPNRRQLVWTDSSYFYKSKDGFSVTINNNPLVSNPAFHNNRYVEVNLEGSLNTNTPPTFTSSPPAGTFANTLYEYRITTTDAQGTTGLNLSAIQLPIWLTLINDGNGIGRFIGQPSSSQVGSHTAVLKVQDADGAFSLQTVLISVSPNISPMIVNQPPTTAMEDAVFNYAIDVTDPDGVALQKTSAGSITISAPQKPAWLNLIQQSEGKALLTGKPTKADVGTHAVKIEVVDSKGAKAEQAFSITVAAKPNALPTFSSAPVTTAEKAKSYQYSIKADDLDGNDGLKIVATKLPNWLTFTDQSKGNATLSGTPQDAQIGKHDVVLEVTDAAGAKVQQTFTITTTGNYSPLAASNLTPANQSTLTIGGSNNALSPTTTFDVSWNPSTDADGDALQYTWQLSSKPDFSTILLTKQNGANTSLKLSFGDINTIALAQFGHGWQEGTMYHRVLVNDVKNADVISAVSAFKLMHGFLVAREEEVPTQTMLYGNYPNPFNPSTNIRFDMAQTGQVSLKVFDLMGREVATLLEGVREAGAYTVPFSMQGLGNAVYMYRLSVNGQVFTGKMQLIK